jgi:hypothetical protein
VKRTAVVFLSSVFLAPCTLLNSILTNEWSTYALHREQLKQVKKNGDRARLFKRIGTGIQSHRHRPTAAGALTIGGPPPGGGGGGYGHSHITKNFPSWHIWFEIPPPTLRADFLRG